MFRVALLFATFHSKNLNFHHSLAKRTNIRAESRSEVGGDGRQMLGWRIKNVPNGKLHRPAR